MNGIVTGAASSADAPILQLFCRSNETLADLDSGTFQIYDITGSAPQSLVGPSAFTANEKLGTGRYVIPTGSTSSWNTGTHRAVCIYKMVSGGPDFTQVIEFEVLNAVDWATSEMYRGLVTSATLVAGGQFGSLTARDLHKVIDKQTRAIEQITGRIFGPHYMELKVSGEDKSILHLQEAIIAVEKVESVSKYPNNEEVRTEWTASSYRVYNRHLDGLLSPDDRRNPMIELVGDVSYVSGEAMPHATTFLWPEGEQNIYITGVFGYTDPAVPAAGNGVSIGIVPTDLNDVVQILALRYLADPTYTSASVHYPGSLRSYKTRDQSVTFGTFGGSSGGGGGGASDMTGDPILDRILLRYARPVNLHYARR